MTLVVKGSPKVSLERVIKGWGQQREWSSEVPAEVPGVGEKD